MSDDPLRWAVERIAEVTAISADKRSDLDWLRAAVSLAHCYAGAALAPIPEPIEADPAAARIERET